MAGIHIIAFLILILYIAWKFKVRFVEAFPVGCSLLVLVLYVLSFFRALSFSDYIAAAGGIAAVIFLLKKPKEQRRQIMGFARKELFGAGTLTALGMSLIVCFCVGGKAVSWWDDYNFWATDVKSLFYLNGFAHKYANVAAEFGDYPPGTQMMKWWFLHFYPGEFQEGLMFAGYYFMILAFLFPLLKTMKRRNFFMMVPGAAALWLFPAVAEGFWLDGCCADLAMAVIYGAFLCAVTDKNHGSLFYYGRQALFLMVLVLCKNTGFIWAAFGMIFSCGYQYLARRKEAADRELSGAVRASCEDTRTEEADGTGKQEEERKKTDAKGLLAVIFLPVLAEGSWLSFCLLNRRVAKLTGTALKMATGSMNIPAYQEDMVKAFGEAFLCWPLHRWKTIAVDLSPLGLYLLLLLFVYLLYRFHILDRKRAVYTGIFFALSGAVFYAFNLLGHLTIFAVETQYLEPFGMISSIERYGAPFTIGSLYLVAYFILNGTKPGVGAALCMAFVLLTTDYVSAYRGLIGYRENVNEILAEREEIIDESAQTFLEKVGAGSQESIGRVLYLRDVSDISWVRNTYISFEAAPVSVMYGNVDTLSMDSEDIANAIRDAHAGFLYVEELNGDGEELLAPFLDGEKFEFERLYQVTEESGRMRLIKAEEIRLGAAQRIACGNQL
ncbi:hypothetical protein D7V94_19875 [Parablautia intestinalis]|uniref:Glycosyltransferase RgtA/B/C/D-like domain-containing protein n=1 Tax=Parablautia intestinalis TaxID=2320100 RepID=A0A3A9AKY2_9FIRM|nr:hypothetical protein [Parablautia intestinalis]RKI88071.1 hypothetical protein D7V94_19875 [Parablautia intestinalis]